MIYRLTLITITLLLILGQFAVAGEVLVLRGADLTGGSYSWPFTSAYWNTPIWPGNKTAKDEVHEYMHRLQGLGFNAVRCMLFLDACLYIPWTSTMQQNLCEYVDLAEEHGLTIYFYISLTNPNYNDPNNDPADDGRIMPDGSIPSPALWAKSYNPTLFNAVVAQANAAVDKTVGYLAANRPASKAIYGWSVGFGEDTQALSSAEFLREVISHVKAIDPYHLVGIECKSGPTQVINGQIVFLPNAPGHSDSQITSRDIYSYLDFIGLANYDLDDNNERMAFYPWATTFVNQVTSQNPQHKPVVVEEYGTDKPETIGANYLLQRVALDTGLSADFQGTFLWNAHVWWDDRPDPNRYGTFNYDSSKLYNLGSEHTQTKVLAERYSSHPWAAYLFEDKTSTTIAVDSQGDCDLTLCNGASKATGRTGKGLTLDGVDDYAEAAYDSVMDNDNLFFEAWVKPTVQQLGCIASRNGCWTLLLGGDNKLHIWANTGSGWAGKLDSTGTISTNNWTRVAISYDGRYWRIYYNGTLDSSSQDIGLINSSSADLTIGATGGGTAYYFQGAIDELQIYPNPSYLVRLRCDGLGSDGHTLYDISGNGLDATLFGGYDTSVSQALPDGLTVNFNGTTGYATISNTSDKATGNIGLNFWVYPRNTTSLQYVLSQGEQTSGSGWGIYILNGELCFAVNTDTANNGYDVLLKRVIPAANTWHHVRAGYDGEVAILSVNGDELDAVGSGPIVYRNGENITLGRIATPAGSYYFNGALDEVQVYSTFIRGAQPPVTPTPTRLVGQWTFDAYGGSGPLENKAVGADWSQMALSGTGAAVSDGVLVLPRYQSGSTWKQSYATTMLQADLGPGGYSKDTTQVIWVKWPGFVSSFWGRLTNVGKFPSSTFSLTALKASESIMFRSGYGWGSCRMWEEVTGGILGVRTGWSYLGGANPPTDRFIKIARVLRLVDSSNYCLEMYWDTGDSQGLVPLGTPVTIPASQINAFGQCGTSCLVDASGGMRYDGMGLMESSSWVNVQSAGEIDFDEVRLYQGALSQTELGGLIPDGVPTRPAVGTSIKDLLDPVARTAASSYDWVVWGRATVIDSNTIRLDDGSGATIEVNIPGHGLLGGEYVSLRGQLDTAVAPPLLLASRMTRHN
ncbi:MAG: LamG-like jellyroll fold domain-containing protein [Armatimonadota bacterium]